MEKNVQPACGLRSDCDERAAAAAAAPTAGDTGAQLGHWVIRSDELRGVWVSYLDWEQLPAERGSYQLAVDKILDRCTELK